MLDGLSHVRSGEITTATRDVEFDGLDVRAGQHIGLLDGSLVVTGESLQSVLRALLERALDEHSELVTLYYGDQLNESEALALAADVQDHFETLDVEIVAGGQPLYPLIISVE
jgi:dihydroxyacetone kinase-like predicted kinase